jgi:hypothetical protein
MQQIICRNTLAHTMLELNAFRQIGQNAQVVEMRKIHSPFPGASRKKDEWIEVLVIVRFTNLPLPPSEPTGSRS